VILLVSVATGLGILAVAVGMWRLWGREPAVPTEPLRIIPFTADGGFKWAPRLSPDGERIAYAWIEPGQRRWGVYVKGLGRGARASPLTDHGMCPAWSPDGRQIAFVRPLAAGVAIYTVPSFGGHERRLIDIAGAVRLQDDTFITSLSWSPDGEWLALCERPRVDEPARIVKVSLTTLEKKPLTFPPAGTLGDLCPELSPDGRTLAFFRSASRTWGGWDVWVQPVSRPEARQVTFGRYGWRGGLAWTADGKELLFSTSQGYKGGGRIFRVPVTGGAPALPAGIGSDTSWPSVRAGRMVHVQPFPESWDVWRLPGRRSRAADRKPEKLIASRWSDAAPSYSPDGRRIAFNSDRSGTGQVWVCDEDGANPVQLTGLGSSAAVWGTPWSPDGRRIVFASGESGGAAIYVVDSEGGVPQRLTYEPSEAGQATFSRDGRSIYFASDRSGRFEIWRIPATGGPAVQVTHGGGLAAQESWDARHVYYAKTEAGKDLWRVPVEGGEETPVPGVQPEAWTEWTLSRAGIYWTSGSRGYYAIHFFDFESGRSEMLFSKQSPADTICLAVSPDEKWILHAEQPNPQSELMLVENFR
jgi:Tol biopolymer transport system component